MTLFTSKDVLTTQQQIETLNIQYVRYRFQTQRDNAQIIGMYKDIFVHHYQRSNTQYFTEYLMLRK